MPDYIFTLGGEALPGPGSALTQQKKSYRFMCRDSLFSESKTIRRAGPKTAITGSGQTVRHGLPG